MYAGALIWLVIVSISAIQLVQTARRMKQLTKFDGPDRPMWQGDKHMQATWEIANMMAALDGWCTKSKKKPTHHLPHRSPSSERTPLASDTPNSTVYGTFSDQGYHRLLCQEVFSKLFIIMFLSMFLLWIAQWLFWGGFIFLISDDLVVYREHSNAEVTIMPVPLLSQFP
ncbi:hypothetical protein N7540_009036 [Penicillium herquei]|nr:hypothetical protein N7540_009036 [Penicillium herquei]